MDEVTILGLSVEEFGDRALMLGVTVAVALVVQRVLVRIASRALEASNVPSASIFVNLLRALIWSVTLLAVLKPVFGIDPTWLVTTIGIVSVAVSLGLQDTISNVVSGFGLMLAKVVKPGDDVTVGSTSGRVVDVTWRSTTVRTRGGDLEVIPNALLNKTSLTHVTRWSQTLCEVPFVALPAADLDLVAVEARGLAADALDGLLDPELGVDVVFSALASTGTEGAVRAHVRDGVALSEAADRVVRALQGRPWIAGA